MGIIFLFFLFLLLLTPTIRNWIYIVFAVGCSTNSEFTEVEAGVSKLVAL
jgi:hypothetical protein